MYLRRVIQVFVIIQGKVGIYPYFFSCEGFYLYPFLLISDSPFFRRKRTYKLREMSFTILISIKKHLLHYPAAIIRQVVIIYRIDGRYTYLAGKVDAVIIG